MQRNFLVRTLFLVLVGAFAFATFSATWFAPPRALAASCAEDANNLLKNGTMAGGRTRPVGVVAKNWKPFVVGATVPVFENALNEGYDPNGSQYLWRDFDAWDAGIFQKVKTLTPGQTYHFWMVWGQSLHDIAGDNARSTLINRQIGVDATGGTNPNAPTVEWTVPYFGGSGFNRPEWHLVFTAPNSTATFFLRAQNGHTDGRNKVFFDTACLYPVNDAPTTTPWATQASTPTPTHTPIPNAIEDTDANILYSNVWQTVNASGASSNTYHTARGIKGSAVAARYTFNGTKITIYYIGNNNHGKAKVLIDGKKVGVIDQYTPEFSYALAQTFENLAPGAHTLKIKNAGAKNLNSSDSYITLDALQLENGERVRFGKNIAARVTPTPKPARAQQTPTRVPPRLIPFKNAKPAADPPSDPSVIWDPRLPDLNVSLETANVAPGTLYWKLIRADYHDPFQHGGDFGGDHNMYFVVTDENGNRITGQKVWQSWPDDSTYAFTDARGIGDIPMWANYFPSNGPGPYNGYVGGLPSDIVRGMGLPANNHVSFVLYFQKTVKSGDALPTHTPTATRTPTPTNIAASPTPTMTRTHTPTNIAASPTPTFTPTLTHPPTAIPNLLIDDTNQSIIYRGAWNVAQDGQAFNTTYHYGAGAKRRAVVAVYPFTGTKITIHYIADRYQGKMRLIVDGKRVALVDQYAEDAVYGLQYTITNLAPGPHKLKIKNAGAKNPAALDTFILLDALEVE